MVITAVIKIIYGHCFFHHNRSFYNHRIGIVDWWRSINYCGGIVIHTIVTAPPAPIPGIITAAIAGIKAQGAETNYNMRIAMVAPPAIAAVAAACYGLHTCHEKNSQCNYHGFHRVTCLPKPCLFLPALRGCVAIK